MIIKNNIPKYETKSLTLAIAGPIGTTEIEYKFGSVENEFGKGDPEKLIFDYFSNKFPEVISKKYEFKEVKRDIAKEKQKIKWLKLSVGDSIVNFLIPNTESPIEFNTFKPDIILFLEDLVISGKGVNIIYSSNVGGAYPYAGGQRPIQTFSNRGIHICAEVILWDNIRSRIIGYGVVSTFTPFPVITLSLWEKAVSYFSEEIFRETPFDYWKTKKIKDPLKNIDVSLSGNYSGVCPDIFYTDLKLEGIVDFNLENEEENEMNLIILKRFKKRFRDKTFERIKLEDIGVYCKCKARFIIPILNSYHIVPGDMGRKKGLINVSFFIYSDIIEKKIDKIVKINAEGSFGWGDSGALEDSISALAKKIKKVK